MTTRAPPHLRAAVFLLCATVSATLRGGTAPAEPITNVLACTVIEADTGKPLAGAQVTLRGEGPEGRFHVTQDTSADGKAAIPRPAGKLRWARLSAWKEGYVPLRVDWPGDAIPAAYTFEFAPGTTIGGTVVDDAGQPVAGATVVLSVPRTDSHSPERVDISFKELSTDSNGAWRCQSVPAELARVALGVYHHGYSSHGRGFYRFEDVSDVSALRDGSARLTLTRGVRIEGTVYDQHGQPLPGARVGLGEDRVMSNLIPETETDAHGRFLLAADPGDAVVVTVRASDHAPELQRFTQGNSARALAFHLQPPVTLRGRVVDASGQPIRHASVCVDTWRNARTLDEDMKTDAEGRFTWLTAPADEVLIDVFATGYADERNVPLKASDTEHVITLYPPLRVHGSVVDAETGEPVAAFRVITGSIWSPDQPPNWDRGDAEDGKNGVFALSLTYPQPQYAVRIEADGYLPTNSRPFTLKEQEVTLAFRLTRGRGLAGIVRTPDGKPAAGADVLVATRGRMLTIRDGRRHAYDRDGAGTVTDAEGRFSLPPPGEEVRLAILHDTGQAILGTNDWATDGGVIALLPWSRVEGTVHVGSRIGTNAQIHINSQMTFDHRTPQVHCSASTVADAGGCFAFDRVFSGKTSVSRHVPTGNDSWVGAWSTSLTVAPGQTVQVAVGGTGRPLLGRLAFPSNMPAAWVQRQANLVTAYEARQPPLPEDWDDMDPDARHAWYKAWQDSPEGTAFLEKEARERDAIRFFGFAVAEDGTFRLDDVPPGSYNLTVDLAEPPTTPRYGFGERIGLARTSVTVAEIPGGQTDEPLDLGAIPFTVQNTVKIGDAAPAFAAQGIDTPGFSLADFKGRYVLLDFWATWCGPCVAELPHLQAAYEAFGARTNFAIVSLNLDKDIETPRKFAKKRELQWTQGFLGEWRKTQVPEAYGVQGIPSIFLIGPDGTIVARGLRGAAIQDALAQHLGR